MVKIPTWNWFEVMMIHKSDNSKKYLLFSRYNIKGDYFDVFPSQEKIFTLKHLPNWVKFEDVFFRVYFKMKWFIERFEDQLKYIELLEREKNVILEYNSLRNSFVRSSEYFGGYKTHVQSMKEEVIVKGNKLLEEEKSIEENKILGAEAVYDENKSYQLDFKTWDMVYSAFGNDRNIKSTVGLFQEFKDRYPRIIQDKKLDFQIGSISQELDNFQWDYKSFPHLMKNSVKCVGGQSDVVMNREMKNGENSGIHKALVSK